MSNEDKIGLWGEVIAQYDEQTVKEYLEIVKREGMDDWRYLEKEKDCVAVLEMLKSVGVISNTKFVELFLNTHSISDWR